MLHYWQHHAATHHRANRLRFWLKCLLQIKLTTKRCSTKNRNLIYITWINCTWHKKLKQCNAKRQNFVGVSVIHQYDKQTERSSRYHTCMARSNESTMHETKGSEWHSTFSFWGWFTGQMTQPTASKHWRKPVGHWDKLQSHQNHSTGCETITQFARPISCIKHHATRVLHHTIVTTEAVLMFPFYSRQSLLIRWGHARRLRSAWFSRLLQHPARRWVGLF